MKWPPKTHIFESPAYASTSWPSSSGLLGHRRTYLTILESADHALFKMVRYVLLRPLRLKLDGRDVEARRVIKKYGSWGAISFEKGFRRVRFLKGEITKISYSCALFILVHWEGRRVVNVQL
jgi:hypothetical protein